MCRCVCDVRVSLPLFEIDETGLSGVDSTDPNRRDSSFERVQIIKEVKEKKKKTRDPESVSLLSRV